MRRILRKKYMAALYSASFLATSTLSPVLASNISWNSATSGTGQNWGTATPTNWTGNTLPGLGDIAVFDTITPSANTVNLADALLSVGAIQDNLTSATAALSINGTSTLTLYGQTATIAGLGGSYSQPNTILSNATTASSTRAMTFGTGVNMILNNAGQNYIATSGGDGSHVGSTITINGNISDGTHGPAAITFFGGGTATVTGGTLNLNGVNTFTGGLTIGNAVSTGTQGGAVAVLNAAALPTVGDITVNEQSQLLFGAPGTYGKAGQNLNIYGIGEGKTSSGVLRTTKYTGTGTLTIEWAGNLNVMGAQASDLTNGYCVISSTNVPQNVLLFSGNVTGGSIQKQGSGLMDFSGANNSWTGSMQVGNGVTQVESGGHLGTGDLWLFQTSTNTAVVNLFNANQTIRNLISSFTAQSGGSSTVDQQTLNLGGDPNNPGNPACVLTINQTGNTSFGYGADQSLTSTIMGPGSIIMGAAATGTLTLTGPNLYQGSTTINGGTLNLANGSNGSATGFGNVIVNNGGKLASGNATVLGAAVTSGTIAGSLTVNTGGIVSPGGDGTIGTLNVPSLVANSGSIFTIDLVGSSHASVDEIIASGAATLTVGGTETINVVGSQQAQGHYQLMSFSGLTNAGTHFTLGTTPGGAGRTYSLSTTAAGVFLDIANTAITRFWSVGGASPATEGADTWSDNSGANVFAVNSNPDTNNYVYHNADNYDMIIGSPTTPGAGGVITLGTNIRVGGNLSFNTMTTPYSIGAVGGTNTLTLAGGISTAVNTVATINAPVILESSQSFFVDSGATATLNGIAEATSGKVLTKDGLGTVVLNGTNTYTGGTVISKGTLQASTTSLPTTGGITDNANLTLSQSTSGSYTGQITGSGSVTINNTDPAAAITLGTTNTYSGATILQGGILNVASLASLGNGQGGIQLAGGTLKATANNLSFPLTGNGNTTQRTITLLAGTTSTIDTGTNNLTLAQNVGGAGNLTKAGAGTLTLTGLPSTTVIGNVAISGGTLVFAPPANTPSFGISSTAGTITGDLTIATPLELRLYGGTFSGTVANPGNIRIKPSGVPINSRGTTVIGNNIILNDNTTPISNFVVNIGASALNPLTINGVISGPGSVNFTSASATITLGGANTYTGSTTIDNSAGASVQLALDNTLPATTAVHVSQHGVLDLNGHIQTIAALDSGNSGSAQVINEAATPATLVINGNTSTTYQGVLEDGATSTLGLTLAAANTGSLALQPTMTGGATPDNTNLISGPLNIAGGRLDVMSVAALGAPSLITVGANAGNSQLRFNGVTGTITFASTLNLTSAPSPITLAGVGGYLNSGHLDTGAIRADNSSAVVLPSPITFTADSGITVTTGSTLQLTGNLFGSGALIKQGNGPLELSAPNAGYTGGTQVNTGTLNVDAASALGTGPLQVNNNQNTGVGTTGIAVVLNLNNKNQTVGSLSGAITAPATGTNTAVINLLAANATLTVNQTTDGVYNGIITGSTAALVKNGTGNLTLNGGNTYGGATTVSAGTLEFDAPLDGSTTSFPTGKSVANSANLVVNTPAAVMTNLTGAGTTTVGSTGNLTAASLTQSNLVNNGATTIKTSGTLTAVTGTGSLTVGSGGAAASATVGSFAQGTLTLNDKATLTLAPATAHLPSTATTLTLNGSAQLDLASGDLLVDRAATPLATVAAYVAAGRAGGWAGPGLVSAVAAASPLVYTLAVVDGGAAGSTGLGVDPSKVLVRPSLVGDANLSGHVDQNDLTAIVSHGFYRDHLATHGWADGDFNGDGQVDQNDLTAIVSSNNYRNNGRFFGIGGGAGPLATTPSLSGRSSASSSLSSSGGGAAAPLAVVGSVGDGVRLHFLYTPATGDLKLQFDGLTGNLQALDLISQRQQFLNQNANAIFANAGNNFNGPDELFSILFQGSFADGLDLGNVLATNLNPGTLAADLTLQYTVQGQSPALGDLLVAGGGGASSPEPASLGLLGLAALGLTARRRRRTH